MFNMNFNSCIKYQLLTVNLLIHNKSTNLHNLNVENVLEYIEMTCTSPFTIYSFNGSF